MNDDLELTPEQIEAIRKTQAQYFREYRKKNPEKNKQACKRYWARRAAREQAAAAAAAGEG